MKTKVLMMLVVGVLLVFNLGVQANTITIISQTHYVWGSAGYNPQNFYDESDNIPVTGSASGVGPSGYPSTASSSAGNFTVVATAFGDYLTREAYAESTYKFTSNSADLTLTLTGGGSTGGWGYESISKFYFYDITAGVEIDSYYWHGPEESPSSGYIIDLENFYTIDPGHQYGLRTYAEISLQSEGGGYHSLLNVSIVPEPATILLIGLGGLALRRKCRAK